MERQTLLEMLAAYVGGVGGSERTAPMASCSVTVSEVGSLATVERGS